jgi:TRAP-type mannitol/chloroaromatic compound transport system permease small subunit
MDLLLKLSRGIDAVNRRIGQFFALMVLAAILVSAINATVRKVFDLSSNSWLELQWVLFSMVFLFCAPWTLMLNEHVRIDIVNSMLPRPVRSKIELIGHVSYP